MFIRKGVVLLFFDLPTLTKQDQRDYRKFRKYLLGNGYVYMQNSTYVKLLKYNEGYKNEVKKIEDILPSKGIVSTLNLTLKEFQKMVNIRGERIDMELFAGNLIEI